MDCLSIFSLSVTHCVEGRWERGSNEHQLEAEMLLQSRYWLAFLKNDAAKMTELISAAMGKRGTEDLLLATQADTEAW